jgi:hypothetical protein
VVVFVKDSQDGDAAARLWMPHDSWKLHISGSIPR